MASPQSIQRGYQHRARIRAMIGSLPPGAEVPVCRTFASALGISSPAAHAHLRRVLDERGIAVACHGPLVVLDAASSPEPFGRRVERLRTERGLTLAQVGAAVGVSGPAVYWWEAGRSWPRAATMQRLADALGVSVGYLRTGAAD